MSLKDNKLRATNPTKLLLARAAAGQGLVLDRDGTQKVAASFVVESMKVETLVGIIQSHEAEIALFEKFQEQVTESFGGSDFDLITGIAAELWPDDEDDEDETADAEGEA